MRRHAVELVVIILAATFGIALDVLCIATLVAVLRDAHSGEGLQFGSAQVLLGWGAGIVAVLSAYVGYSFGKRSRPDDDHEVS